METSHYQIHSNCNVVECKDLVNFQPIYKMHPSGIRFFSVKTSLNADLTKILQRRSKEILRGPFVSFAAHCKACAHKHKIKSIEILYLIVCSIPVITLKKPPMLWQTISS